MPSHGPSVDHTIAQLHWLASIGIETVIASVADVWKLAPLELISRMVIPAVAGLTPATV